ncbi:hypothetical protein QT381_15165 [Galbitalea sp. SE-J8]|uniref:hypothetical protein n=1 Tax=Galbitalea sp. SE-J8 TaxID=3054952 RepID=UPI00259CC0AB|nr:hypothetical protein [Galbitalea sp. SE-J8]MDM4764341.1 hypothetical protein [Galbitalea sp. SE-J8]
MDELPTTANDLILAQDARTLDLAHRLRSAVRRGQVERVRPGAYRARETDAAARTPWERDRLRYRALVAAAAASMPGAVFAGPSAAVLLGLPVRGRWPDEVYVMSGNPNGHRRAGVIAIGSTAGAGVTHSVDGIAVTSVEFTIIQTNRRLGIGSGLYAANAALHVDRFTRIPPLTTRELLIAEHERMKPYQGSRRSEQLFTRMTELCDTPLETEQLIAIEELGFERPVLQRGLWLPELSAMSYLDTYWPSVDAAGEADGRGKYLGTDGRGRHLGTDGRADDAVARVLAEKNRENAIRRQVRAFDRWDWDDVMLRRPLEQRLEGLGVPRTSKRIRLV